MREGGLGINGNHPVKRIAEHASPSQWAPNDWVGDQCDMTLVGGFRRQRGEISAVLFRRRGSRAAERAKAH